MSDYDLSLVLEPVRLPFSERLFSAAHREALPDGTDVLTDLDRAMLLENSQELPPEYRIWQDVQANAVSPFYCTDAYAAISTDIENAIAPFWDVQVGVRQDLKPSPEREWGVIGIQGLAPYFFEIDAALFVGDSGDTAARLSAEYEWMFTQKVVLSPEVSVNFYGQNDMHRQTGSGLADAQAGLRLRYEIRREFAPYIGVNWTKSFGNTADFVREHDESTSDTQWVAGVRAWF